MNIDGNLTGVARKYLEVLDVFSKKRWVKDILISSEDAMFLKNLSEKIGREIAVYVNRNGFVEKVVVGESDTVNISLLNKKRDYKGYLGIKLIHTHPYASSAFSCADLSTLQNSHFDCIVAIGGLNTTEISFAFLEYDLNDKFFPKVYEHLSLKKAENIIFSKLIYELEKTYQRQNNYETNPIKEKVILAFQPQNDSSQFKHELYELAKTANLEVVGELEQRQRGKKKYFGEGKKKELALLIQDLGADCVIFDQRLTPAELTQLTLQLGIKVLDKTALILDIFASRAKSKEGKLQVELAQLTYLLPRLIGKGIGLSRQGGGIGTRGPGETQLETDKRHIRKRIDFIKREIEAIEKNRKTQSESRKNKDIFQFSLVGYTNAGKSSLLNLLADENIYVADQLFATLDSTTRRLSFLDDMATLLSDTVGFIRELPPELVEAFKSTLLELDNADIIMHVVDISDDAYEKKISIVNDMLKSLGLQEKRQIYIFNKIDNLDNIEPFKQKEDKLYISVKNHTGIDDLKERMRELVNESTTVYSLFIDHKYNPSKVIAELYKYGKVSDIEYGYEGVHLNFKANYALPNQFENFLVK